MVAAKKAAMAGVVAGVALLLSGRSVSAQQVDITGAWRLQVTEDFWHRLAGLEIGDYTGLPINQAGRQKAESWDESVLAEPERQCIPHVATYNLRGGSGGIRIANITDPSTDVLLGYHISGMYGRADRDVWTDGRPHPPEYAKHTYAGFSTGKWEDGVLTVTTTHIKMGWIQRNGVPTSDRATMVDHFVRHDNLLVVETIVTDPVFLAEPFVRTTHWVNDQTFNPGGAFPCGPDQVTEEATGWEDHHVPHHLPGTNDQLAEFAASRGIPPEAAAGGPETTRPEYLATLKALAAKYSSTLTPAIVDRTDLTLGRWLLDRGKSTFSGVVPEKRTMAIEKTAAGIRYHIDTWPMANDSGFNRVEYTAAYDGRDYTTLGSGLTTVSLKQVDARTVVRTGKVGDLVVETATASVSPDGNTMTFTIKGTIQGKPYSEVELFERQ